jgi:excisionase family DNA binding protein
MKTDSLSDLARSLTGALDDEGLRDLAARLSPYLDRPVGSSETERLLSAAEVAKRASVNVETVRRAIRAGDLQVAARIGRSPRMNAVAVESWFAKTARIRDEARSRVRRRASSPRDERQSLLAALMDGE